MSVHSVGTSRRRLQALSTNKSPGSAPAMWNVISSFCCRGVHLMISIILPVRGAEALLSMHRAHTVYSIKSIVGASLFSVGIIIAVTVTIRDHVT